MLVALGASVARDAGDAVLTGTLARGLVTGLARGAHGMAIALCGGNTQEEGEGARRAEAGKVARLHQQRLGVLQASRPAGDRTDLKQRWCLAQEQRGPGGTSHICYGCFVLRGAGEQNGVPEVLL